MAENMSCANAYEMSARYDQGNQSLLNYSLQVPNLCERYQTISDKQAEYKLQAGNGLTRNLCFNADPKLKPGDYSRQFQPIRPIPESFLVSTKQKTRTQGM
jgi:hypothetical protein